MYFPYFKVLNLSILTPDKYGFSLGKKSVYFLGLLQRITWTSKDMDKITSEWDLNHNKTNN